MPSAEDSGLVNRSAAASIQPGQYKADRDFVNDITSEVRKDVDARFRQAPRSLDLDMRSFCLASFSGLAETYDGKATQHDHQPAAEQSRLLTREVEFTTAGKMRRRWRDVSHVMT